jgi:2,4-dienoyl-CoA reductase-like NADH-dependent reductase (Old Yellow Enzyme family)
LTPSLLFEPFRLRHNDLRNRVVMAPMTRFFSRRGVPGADIVGYYSRRAEGEVGLIMSEGIYVDPTSGPSASVPRLYGEESIEAWRRVVEGVHANGGTILAQLWHLGAMRGHAPEFSVDRASVSPSGIGPGDSTGKELTLEEIDELVGHYARAARVATDIGFDGVEVHGAHGYLIDQFMWRATNHRSDAFPAGPAFPRAIVSAVRDAIGAGPIVSFRFSQWKLRHYDAKLATTPHELERLLLPIVESGVDLVHASTRRFWEPEFPGETGPDASLGLAGWARKVTGLPTVAVGSIGLKADFYGESGHNISSDISSLEELHRRIRAGEFDLAAVGRALLADPQWVRKVRDGRSNELAPYRITDRDVLS